MVPRPSVCLSEKFLEMMNNFGNLGGFDLIIDNLENNLAGPEIDLNSICYMSTMITMPIALWHKDWVNEYAERTALAVKKQLYEASDKTHRALDKSAYQQAVNSIGYIYNKIKNRDDCQKECEVLAYIMCKKGLKSELLDRRIQGMKELNMLVKKAAPLGNI